eukprot:CAMPEP_0194151664 /NCGR_PEP_ID=MMETSP0152-20130528/49222_1 /TAXON_ID=1049557 /ORGANISM="Thalassiothrix antarctica, Strain L6-D1" /LENGTH=136 /DNA_ID=CAMNT_0038855667 /DNA_START=59 /DNA_END=469 /DNA_ORIENTATION=+
MSNHVLQRIAAVLGSSGVMLGAFGAHALKQTLEERGSLAMWQTACMYQLFHAAALMGMAGENSYVRPMAGKLMSAGTAIFSGSIYFLSLGIGPKAVLGPVTPFGGMLMIAGWILAFFPKIVDQEFSDYQEADQDES